MSDIPLFPAARLLTHTDFLYRLGRRLAGRDDGDDLAHETLLAAAARPPRPGNDRGWLATVMENLWRNRQRGERRRTAREVARGGDETGPDVADIVELEELRQRIVAAVVALPPLLRDVVLLRYYEGLDSRAIGVRLQVAPSTVRTRHQDAMQALRERLDAEHGGRRAAWTGVLLRWQTAAAPARASVALAAWLAAAFCAALAVWYVAWSDAPASPVAARAVADAGAAAPVVAAKAAPPDTPAPERTPVAMADAGPSTGYPWRRPLCLLQGIVLDAATRLPAADTDVVARGVQLDCSSFVNVAEIPRVERRARTGPDGTFTLEGLPFGSCDVEVFGGPARHGFLRAHLDTIPNRVEILLFDQPERGLAAVRVVDAAGEPVAGAEVELALGGPRSGWYGWPARGPFRGTTDERGRFELQRDDLDGIERGAARARDANGRIGYARSVRETEGARRPFRVEVVLRPGGAIVGRLTGLANWRSVRVIAHRTAAVFGEPDCFDVSAPVAADGRYRIEGLAAGEYKVQVDGLARRADNEEFWNTLPTRVEAGETAVAVPPELACVAGATVAGTVVAADGTPIAAATVTARRPWANDLGRYLLHHGERQTARWYLEKSARTAADGRYEIALPAGEWQVLATATGRTLDVQLGLVAEGGAVHELRHVLVADGALAGSLPEQWALRWQERPDVVHVVPALFHLRGLHPGTWEAGPYEVAGTFTARATVDVIAGRTVWIDCVSAAERVYRGVLRHGGVPLAGYDVSFGEDGVPVRTAAEGSFELRDTKRRAGPPVQRVRSGGLHIADSEQADSVAVTTDGSFELREAEKRGGPPVLRVCCGGLHIADSKQVDGVIELPGRMIDVRTTSREGHPVAAMIAIGDAFDHDKYETCNGPGAVRCEDGALRFLLARQSKWTHVVATFDDGSRVRVAVADQRSITIVRPSTGAVAVRVCDGAGAPLRDWSVRVLAWGGRDPAPADAETFRANCADREETVSDRTDGEGRALLRGVCPGPALVEAWPPGRSGEATCRRIVTVATGGTLSIELTSAN